MWTGPIFMGGNTELDVVYDTGSDWLVIESIECSNCQGNKYDPKYSNGDPTAKTQAISQRNYGSASLNGYEFYDKVCIDLNHCLESFEFFMITSQTGISEPIDGILGLSRNEGFALNPGSRSTGPLFVEHLYEDGIIKEDKFSFYFQQPDQDSWMDLGQPVYDHVKEGSNLIDTKMIANDFFWSFYNTGIAVGTIDNAFAYERNSQLTPEY